MNMKPSAEHEERVADLARKIQADVERSRTVRLTLECPVCHCSNNGIFDGRTPIGEAASLLLKYHKGHQQSVQVWFEMAGGYALSDPTRPAP